MGRVADHAVIEASAHGQQNITVLHRHVGFKGAMHAQHAEELGIARGIGSQTHQGVGARVAEEVHQLTQFSRSLAEDHATTAVDVRALGRHEQLHRLADLPAMPLANRAVRTHLERRGIGKRRGLERDILGDVDHHRSRTSGAGDVKRFLDGQGQIAHVLDEEVVLDDRPCDAHRIAFLECIQPDRRRGNLAGDDDHRNAVHVGGGDAGDRIGHPGTRRHQSNTHLTRGTGVAVCSMNRRLLMANQHVLDGVLLVQRVVDVQHRSAGVAPEELDVFKLQASNEYFGAVGLGGSCARSDLRRRCFGALDLVGRHVHGEPL